MAKIAELHGVPWIGICLQGVPLPPGSVPKDRPLLFLRKAGTLPELGVFFIYFFKIIQRPELDILIVYFKPLLSGKGSVVET